MITFKEFLTEAAKKKDRLPVNVVSKWGKEDLSIEKMIEMVNANCRESLRAIQQPSGLLFRGFGTLPGPKGKPVFLDSSSAFRTSRDSNNIYQLLMDRSPEMQQKGIPSRSKSFICITDRANAGIHGGDNGVYVMLPYNGTTVAYTASDDIFNSRINIPQFDMRGEGTAEAGATLGERLQAMGIKPDFGSMRYKDADYINREIAKIAPEVVAVFIFGELDFYDIFKDNIFDDANITYAAQQRITNAFSLGKKEKDRALMADTLKKYESSIRPAFKKKIEIVRQNHDAFFDYIASLMKTSQFAIKTAVAGQKIPYEVECWFSGKCIAIPEQLFKKMLLKMRENGTKIHKNVWDEFRYLEE